MTPEGSADNVFLRIDRGQSFLYLFQIPSRHPAGLYWHHPHIHGLSDIQVRSGLAGAFRIRGDFDGIGDLPDATEYDIVYQTLDYFVHNDPHSEEPHLHHPSPADPPPSLVLISGAPQSETQANVTPTLKVLQGGLLRLRILNAAANQIVRLRFSTPAPGREHLGYLIATDGHPVPEPVRIDELVMAPGERAELLVKTDQREGRFSLLELPYNSIGNAIRPNAPTARVTFEYSGTAPRELQIPEKLKSVESLPPSGRPVRRLQLTQDLERDEFSINGLKFDPSRVNMSVSLGVIEDWDLFNNTILDHTVHLHTNPFQVVEADGSAQRVWRDSIVLRRGQEIRVRVAFRDFSGQTVFHCHLLAHEDHGMMQLMEIEGPFRPRARTGRT